MGVECIHAPFHISVQDFLQSRGHEFDLVFITRYDVAERHIDHVRQHSKAKVLFNNADLHFLRELRSHLSKGHTELSGPLATRDRELALMRKVDAILAYNEMEHAVIASHNLRGDNIFKCPWVLPAHGHQTPFEQREGIAFLGGYRHHPNIEAVEFFLEKVIPLLRSRGKGIKFHIYGSNPPKEFELLDGGVDVVVEGYVESLDDVFEKCRVFVAPLLSGAGIKGKVLESMSYGVPSVLSPVAAEATGLSNGISALIAETPEEWVDAIITLYEDKQKWQAMSENALVLARSNYSFEHGWKLMGKALAFLGFYSGKMDSHVVAR
jgi:glycosyltransferase involved in cell wall biosynthesis